MNIQPTPYDLKFRLFRIPIRVHPSFWLVSAFFAFPLASHGIQFVLIGIACVFVSVMAHELGHALMFRCYHMWSMIVLYGFGGLTAPEGGLPKRSWRIIVSLCGPLANFAVLGIVWGSNYIEPWVDPLNNYSAIIYGYLFIINLYLGLLNLLPVYPLDGGQISRELWSIRQPGMGRVNSLRMSMIVAIGFSAYAFGCHFNLIPPDWILGWLRPGIFAAIIFAILAVENYVELENLRRSRLYDRTPWER